MKQVMVALLDPFRDLARLLFAALCVAATVAGWVWRRR